MRLNPRMPFKAKLIWAFLTVGILPMLIVSLIANNQMVDVLKKTSNEKLAAIGDRQMNLIVTLVSQLGDAMKDLTQNASTATALHDFSESFGSFGGMALSENEAEKIGDFYKKTFVGKYKELHPDFSEPSGQEMFKSLDSQALVAQTNFVINNPEPSEQKNKMLRSKSGGPYSDVHQKYHPSLNYYIETYGLYDLFLVRADGRVVYSAFKEIDFGAQLTNSFLKDSGLAKAFEATKKMKAGDIYIEDYSLYLPSYDVPTSFMSAPVYHQGRYIGAVIFQLPTKKINQATAQVGAGGSDSEILVVGADMKLRGDTVRSKKKLTVAEFFNPNSKLSIDTDALKMAKSGKQGSVKQVSHDGLDVWAFYSPIHLYNLTWYLSVDMPESVLMAELRQMHWVFLILCVISVLCVAGVAWMTGGNISGRLQDVAKRLSHSGQELTMAASASASTSTELSEAATEQAASLQETMASIEQISAMVNQNAESANKVKDVVDGNQKATKEGTASVVEMGSAINEIKKTNDDILLQMESSNKEFNEIVRIISDIGEKTKVINDIVFQTKLLSFNASVEAARAGEHGKGFSVVAEEVGNLAQMSGNAAKEITDMLEHSVKKVNEIVEKTTVRVDRLVEVGKDKITMGQATAQRCQEALQKISENANLITSMVGEIAHASKEQAQGVQEINKAISQLDQVTQQNSSMAQTSSSQAEQLSAQSSALKDVVTSLVAFIDGEGALTKVPRPMPTGGAKILPLERPIKAPLKAAPKPQPAEEKTKQGKMTKKAAGEDFAPAHDDPQFEEF